MLRLNEVVPNPSAGKEWIEIVTLDASQKSTSEDVRFMIPLVESTRWEAKRSTPQNRDMSSYRFHPLV